RSYRELVNAPTIAQMWAQMSQEVAVGQYLDVYQSTLPLENTPDALASALSVVRHKSGRYSVEHPLALGAAIGGGSDELVTQLRQVGAALGEAFQMRDDDLGVFGDPAKTGKPAGDDLREGKRTPLIALTLQRANPAQLALLQRHLGDATITAEIVEQLQEVIEHSGARAAHEELIDHRRHLALSLLEEIPDAQGEGIAAVRHLAHQLTDRRS
ncbi:MAG: polyprenyl synthetase family protein, partial [Bowdeniella nasicola]|nr:polyprenyl synthetase family protein [Bowdeniella nasicola]